jgi:putative radical SAM enzyme (TIGR03279 family)
MECQKKRRCHLISHVKAGGAAGRAGVRPGDLLVSIGGEPILDEIDYQFLSMEQDAVLGVLRGGEALTFPCEKEEGEPLGLRFSAPLTGKTHTCANRCVFCFVDQMPPGLRETLYVKDDDWRMSLRNGQYITLTNVSDREFARVLARRASPLYISVHATEPDVRARMLGNERAGRLMERLRALKEAGLRFHAQIVLCPGYNDGEVFERTLRDLFDLWPAALSVAVVPVGLTKYRQGLARVEDITCETARAALARVEAWQRECLARIGTRFCFAADEMYVKAGLQLPPFEAYEDFPQIENGVGMLRQLEDEYLFAMEDMPTVRPRSVLMPCGVAAAAFLRQMLDEHPVPGVDVEILPVENRFFGETVTVSGLITGQDLAQALVGKAADEVLITSCMLRSREEEIFLDDMTLDEVRRQTGLAIRQAGYDGEALLRALAGAEEAI